MGKQIAVLAGCLLLGAQMAHAGVLDDFSATVTGVSDYSFRGVSLSAGDPALQGSIDYSHGLFYASVWGSNLKYGSDYDGSTEVDVILGLTGETQSKWRWDVGGVWYTYPGSSSDENQSQIYSYPELYVGGGTGVFDAKLWYTWDNSGTHDTTYYAEGNLNFTLPRDFGLSFHAGYYFGQMFNNIKHDAEANPTGEDPSYWDYSVGLTKSIDHFDFALKYVTTDTNQAFKIDEGPFRNDDRIIFSMSTTFPWKKAE